MRENRRQTGSMASTFDPEIGRATRWKKGQASPNPGGRPKAMVLTEAYRAVLAKRFPGDRQRRTVAEVIAARVAAEAASGSVRAAAEIADRTEGKARQALELAPPDPASVSLQEELGSLTTEELHDRVIEMALEMDKAAEMAGIQDRLAAARAERVKPPMEVCRNYTLIETAKLHSS